MHEGQPKPDAIQFAPSLVAHYYITTQSRRAVFGVVKARWGAFPIHGPTLRKSMEQNRGEGVASAILQRSEAKPTRILTRGFAGWVD